jgi:alkaline phosphatase
MISDGCGYNQIDAAGLYLFGETGQHVFEGFPVIYAMSTHSAGGVKYTPDSSWHSFDWVLKKPTDSAASATAFACGVKTYNGYIAMDTEGKPLETIMERSEEKGKMTGVVSSVLLSHATPASFLVHNISRGNYEEIATSMFRETAADVIMGCGHPDFDDDGNVTKLYEYKYVGGKPTWEELQAGTLGGDADGDGVADPWVLIEKRKEFQKLMSGPTPKRVVGIPMVRSTLQQKRSGNAKAAPYEVPLHETSPTLVEMTTAALNVLDSDPDGFTLMIEGGAVDWASHANQPGRVIEEEIDFSNTVQTVVNWVDQNSSWDETLLVVTGDHETGYLTGPGSGGTEPVWNQLTNNGKGKQPGMEWHSGGHTNSLIPFYAKGGYSESFHKYAKNDDPVRGKYLDNANVGEVLMELLN